METYNEWDEVMDKNIPLPEDNFDQYFTEYNEIDNLFNETLTGLQDLDVPSGFATKIQDASLAQTTTVNHHQAKHSRKISGTAIFGFSDHNRELSIGGLNSDLYKSVKHSLDLGKSVSPGDLLRSLSSHHSSQNDPILLENPPAVRMEKKATKEISPVKFQKESKDYIVTNTNPKSYKFPPSPETSSQPPLSFEKSDTKGGFQSVNNYSVRYLQNLKSPSRHHEAYVDDIEPLLESNALAEQQNNPFNPQNGYKYVPIPVQQPVGYKKVHSQLQNIPNPQLKNNFNSFLPPPSPPTLSNGSPEWQSSPEPQSPSPSRVVNNDHNQHKFSSPIHPQLRGKVNFYTPQFFSESENFLGDGYQNEQTYSNNQNPQLENNQIRQPSHTSPFQTNMGVQLQSSPIYGPNKSLNSSPVKYYTSPLRNLQSTNDDTVDANATITQLTPLKNTLPNTPARNQMRLEWSPIISPNAKASKDVKKHIQQSSVRRRVKKTSLLPPGELDNYWVGPNEDKIYLCTFKGCGKEFTRRYNVRSHIQTHLSDRPFACPSCPKRFVRQHDLNRHIKGHLETRNCKCTCGKEFARLDALKKHRNRNICVGGITSNVNHCVTKPQKKRMNSSDFLDDITSEKLTEHLSSSLAETYS
ncbi:uncharacterized protein CANTADRAFT_49926 [Suhomyces tanzawaensis NRRL Y-17324]|uniref:C2H2-type domain-containing protein n=1 Tax=Suhomyces tanzawaensis NRRL Y-17324 TaxID=984487 RepID=A0A1E4SL63_9ASCO|nr:uncharacterized protein CANTADRAFT_49926 [Suhomyces tanzawaensis NRRL Y-17324]ODV80243.1 hypothetical protein CANTADRAFT_49926 [Suhomyces tanzawaensis NRRL Y-17324]